MVRNLRSKKGSTALRYGTIWHTILEEHYKGKVFEEIMPVAFEAWVKDTKEFDFQDDYRTLEVAYDAFSLYRNHFQYDHELEVLHTERVFDVVLEPIYHHSEVFNIHFTGKVDMEVKMDGLRWVFENKTTGQYIATQANRLKNDPQIVGYAWAGKAIDEEVIGCIINLHSLSSRKKKDGNYGTIQIDFARLPCMFSEKDFYEWKYSFLDTAHRIIQCELTESWPQHRENCWNYNLPCSYLPLCDSHIALLDDPGEEYILHTWNMKHPGK